MGKKLERESEKTLWQWKVMEYLSYLVVFLIPLYFNTNHDLFSFSAPKTILTIGLVLLITIFYLWGILAEKKLMFKFTPLHIVLGVFLFILTLSSILGVDPLNSFFGKWIDGINLILIYTVIIFALLIGFLVKRDKTFIIRILLASFISGVCVAIISYTGSSWMSIFKDGSSTIGNNSYTGSYLLFNACFGVGLFFYYSKIWKKISIALGTIVVTLSPLFFNTDIFLGKVGFRDILHNPFLLFGQANAATVGLAVSFLVIIIFFLIFSSKKVSKIIGLVFLLGLLVGIFYTGIKLVNPESSLHKVFVEKKAENRFVSWNIAAISFNEHPLLGSGFNNFSYSYQKYFSSDILKEKLPEFYFYQPHNVIWEYASNNGLLGLASFLSLLLFTFLALFGCKEGEERKDIIIRIVLISILFGYFVQNLFGFDTPVTYLMLFFVVGLAIGLSRKEWNYVIIDKHNDGYKFISSLLIVSFFIAIIFFAVLPFTEFKKLGRVISANTISERMALRDGVGDISLFGGVFDSSYLAGKYFNLYQQDVNKINNSNKDIYLKEIDSSVNLVEKDIVKQPDEVFSHIILNSLLNMEIFIKGNTDMETWNYSYNNIKRAISLNPENPESYLQLAQTYILNEDFKDAYTSIRQAIAIAPSYAKSYEYARKILTIKPDKDFEKYVDSMEGRWIGMATSN